MFRSSPNLLKFKDQNLAWPNDTNTNLSLLSFWPPIIYVSFYHQTFTWSLASGNVVEVTEKELAAFCSTGLIMDSFVLCAVHGMRSILRYVHIHGVYPFNCFFQSTSLWSPNGSKVYFSRLAMASLPRTTSSHPPVLVTIEPSLPPEPVITRWGTWIKAAIFYAEHFEAIKELILDIEDNSQCVVQSQLMSLSILEKSLYLRNGHLAVEVMIPSDVEVESGATGVDGK
ncbi:hypothetical protein HUJ04_006962 [Dendroctonus ponderosae]|nr:hypothetical protein HUJ04_006962 [Dendroctonus ponderosae]